MPNFKVEINGPKSGPDVFEAKTLTMREAIKKVLDSRESTGLFGGSTIKITVAQITEPRDRLDFVNARHQVICETPLPSLF